MSGVRGPDCERPGLTKESGRLLASCHSSLVVADSHHGDRRLADDQLGDEREDGIPGTPRTT
ncbi:hypothetical protein [Halosimplex amylolyticum]|uniref:hypothetical protein n=1 Tax=Halosimplex amylolyticum TaxID=3396616 RepID=UPI003F57C94A